MSSWLDDAVFMQVMDLQREVFSVQRLFARKWLLDCMYMEQIDPNKLFRLCREKREKNKVISSI